MKSVRMNTRSLATLPGVVWGVFPTLVCPGCWPAYTGFLSALGLPFIPTGTYLLPLTLAFLAVAVIALGIGWRRGHRSGPFVLGVCGSAGILVGRFVAPDQTAAYIGAGLLLAASVWNSIPLRAPEPVLCGNCASQDEMNDKGDFQK